MFNIKENIYSAIVPKGEWKAAIFCRMNPNNLENRWNNEGEENGPIWGAQTKEVIYEEGKNHYIINNIDNPWNGNYIQQNEKCTPCKTKGTIKQKKQ